MMSRLAEKIDDAQVDGIRRSLTESFRYGPRAADVASKILSLGCQQKVKIIGRGKDEPNLKEGSRCYLARTNASLMDAALSTLSTSNPYAVIHFAGTTAINRYDPTVPYKLNLIRSIFHYFANQRHLATDPTVKRFEDWTEILQHAKGGENGQDGEAADKELAAAVHFVEKHRFETLDVLDLIVSRSGGPTQAIASFSTAHRAKGLEWDHVHILDDFPKLGSEMQRNENGELQLPDEQELNLLYVATTRGRKWVELNQDLLEFVESEFQKHFDELRPSNVQRSKGRVSEEPVKAVI
jgi:F-box protein, helicase, 18